MASLLLFSAHFVVISMGLCKSWNNKYMSLYTACVFCWVFFFYCVHTFFHANIEKTNHKLLPEYLTFSFVVLPYSCPAWVLISSLFVSSSVLGLFPFLTQTETYRFKPSMISFTIRFSVNLYDFTFCDILSQEELRTVEQLGKQV